MFNRATIQKKYKRGHATIAIIFLVAIIVVLAATLVTILGGFTHGVTSSEVSTHATTQEVDNFNTGNYTVYFNVTSSTPSLATSHLSVSINGTVLGTFSTFLTNASHSVKGYANPTTLTGGSHFEFNNTSEVTSFELIYRGNVIYQSGTITLS